MLSCKTIVEQREKRTQLNSGPSHDLLKRILEMKTQELIHFKCTYVFVYMIITM